MFLSTVELVLNGTENMIYNNVHSQILISLLLNVILISEDRLISLPKLLSVRTFFPIF